MIFMKFIYVFEPDAKEKLLALGFQLLKEDAGNNIYVFEANESLQFGLDDISFMYSDKLTF